MHCSSAARNTSNFNFSCRNSPLKIKAQVVWADCPVVISLFVTDCHASDSNTIILYFKTAAVHSRGVAVLSYENMKRTAGGKLLSRLETSPAHSVPLETAAASHSTSITRRESSCHQPTSSYSLANNHHQPRQTKVWQEIRGLWGGESSSPASALAIWSSALIWAEHHWTLWSPQQQGGNIILHISQPTL